MKAIKALIVFALLVTGSQAYAKVNFIEALAENYPNIIDDETGKLLDCFSCHTTDKWQRNDFGSDLEFAVRNNYPGPGTPTNDTVYEREYIKQMLTMIEKVDSDGDGVSNGDELKNNNCPGDPKDFPGQSYPAGHKCSPNPYFN